MPNNTPSKTEAFFDSYAVDFNSIYGNEHARFTGFINRVFRRSMRLRYEYTIKACDPIKDHSVLDIGCGPGHYSIALASRGASHVLGLDFAPGMIQIAQAKAREAGLESVCEFLTGDFFELDETAQYDYVILMGFMDYMEDAGAVIDKALRLTRKTCFFSFPSSGGILAWQRRMRYKSRCPLYLYSKEDLIRLFSIRNGFRSQIKKIDRDYWVKAQRKA